MTILTDDSPMPFGKYSGQSLEKVPASYLHWLWTNGLKQKVATDSVAEYINRNLSALKEEHEEGVW